MLTTKSPYLLTHFSPVRSRLSPKWHPVRWRSAQAKAALVVYNKAVAPTQVGVVLAKKGKSSELGAMLDALVKLQEGTDLVSIITPERTFVDYTVVGFDYDRKRENGVDQAAGKPFLAGSSAGQTGIHQ